MRIPSCIWVYVAIDMVVYGWMWLSMDVSACRMPYMAAVYGHAWYAWLYLIADGRRWLYMGCMTVCRGVTAKYMVVYGCVVVDGSL